VRSGESFGVIGRFFGQKAGVLLGVAFDWFYGIDSAIFRGDRNNG
jgi:hypothetical protein